MAQRTAGAEVLGGLNTLTRYGVAGNLSDAQLLARFLARGGEAADEAFEALVARHGPMVLEVCRNILRDPHDAQDAFQATFLVLASRAAAIRRGEALAGWLLGVAQACRGSIQSRFDPATGVRGAGRGDPRGRRGDPSRVLAGTARGIGRLPERYREPVVLCYLEGLSTDEAAHRLGCPKGTSYPPLPGTGAAQGSG